MDADEFTARLAQEDQDKAEITDGIKSFADRLSQLRVALIIGGFHPDEVFELVCKFADAIIANTIVANWTPPESV